MNMRSTLGAREFARERFTCETGEGERIEIEVSIASIPLAVPSPGARDFEFRVVTPAGTSFVVQGGAILDAAVPLVDRPPPPPD